MQTLYILILALSFIFHQKKYEVVTNYQNFMDKDIKTQKLGTLPKIRMLIYERAEIRI